VLLDTGPVGHRYLYGVSLSRHEGRWRETSSSNGAGWSSSSTDGALGTWSLWAEAPEGADRIRVTDAGQVSEHPVEEGLYLIVLFKRPARPAPAIAAFRIAGAWVPYTGWD
jgi:hypothetical protein